MKVHLFQRYHSKENVATANSMLLLSRLYSYSPDKLFLLLDFILTENKDIKIHFNMQERIVGGTTPDATIGQASFKVIIETKLYSQFSLSQLKGHLKGFKNEDYKVLLTLDPREISEKLKKKTWK